MRISQSVRDMLEFMRTDRVCVRIQGGPPSSVIRRLPTPVRAISASEP